MKHFAPCSVWLLDTRNMEWHFLVFDMEIPIEIEIGADHLTCKKNSERCLEHAPCVTWCCDALSPSV